MVPLSKVFLVLFLNFGAIFQITLEIQTPTLRAPVVRVFFASLALGAKIATHVNVL